MTETEKERDNLKIALQTIMEDPKYNPETNEYTVCMSKPVYDVLSSVERLPRLYGVDKELLSKLKDQERSINNFRRSQHEMSIYQSAAEDKLKSAIGENLELNTRVSFLEERLNSTELALQKSEFNLRQCRTARDNFYKQLRDTEDEKSISDKKVELFEEMDEHWEQGELILCALLKLLGKPDVEEFPGDIRDELFDLYDQGVTWAGWGEENPDQLKLEMSKDCIICLNECICELVDTDLSRMHNA